MRGKYSLETGLAYVISWSLSKLLLSKLFGTGQMVRWGKVTKQEKEKRKMILRRLLYPIQNIV
jgi:hypothetical protein